MCLLPALAVLVPSNTSQKRSANRSQAWENHVSDERSAASSQERIHAAALFLFDMFAPGVVISPSASTATAATTAVPPFVVLVVVALVVIVFATAIDGLVLL